MPDLYSTKRISRVGRFDGWSRVSRVRRAGKWERAHGWIRLTPANARRLEQEGVRFRRGRVALRQHRWSTGSGAQGSVSRGRRGFDPDALLDGPTRSWRSSTPR